MDNARIHHARDVAAFLANNEIRHMFLPRSSPDLNPIENLFGTIKSRFRRRGVVRTNQQLKTRLRRTIDEVDNELDFQKYYNQMRVYVQKALNRQDFN